jgi:hypothetical protein
MDYDADKVDDAVLALFTLMRRMNSVPVLGRDTIEKRSIDCTKRAS